MGSLQNKQFQIAILLFLGFIWGSSFILMKKSLLLFSDLELGAIRIFSAGIVLLPFALKGVKNINKQQLYYITLSGFLGSGIPAFLFTIAQNHITSTEASIYNSLTPLFTFNYCGFLVLNKSESFKYNRCINRLSRHYLFNYSAK